MGCPLYQLIMEEICHTSVKAGSFLSGCPQRLKAADGRVMAGITQMWGSTAPAAFHALTGVIIQLASTSRWARWSCAMVWLSIGPEFDSAVAICTSRVRPYPLLPFAYSLLLLLLCRAAPKFIRQQSLPPLLPLCSQQHRCVVIETISKGFNLSWCQSTSCKKVLCNGKAF